MSQPLITLYAYCDSPYALKVAAFLDHKKLDYDVVYVNPIHRRELEFVHEKPSRRIVPVLKVGDEWREDSTPIGLWLDQLFPDRPMLPQDDAERRRVMADDEWVTTEIIPGIFREMYDPESLRSRFCIGWRLGEVMHLTSGTPYWMYLAWPFIVPYAPFVGRTVRQNLDLNEPINEMRKRQHREFGERLKGGPFLGGSSVPTLADLSAYGQIEHPRLVGLPNPNPIWEAPEVKPWLKAMRPLMSPRPPLIAPVLPPSIS